MMTTATPAYEILSATWTRMHNLSHLQSIAGWDQAANMPPKGNEARAAAMAEMATLLHRMRTDPRCPISWHAPSRSRCRTCSAPTCAR
jgi:carboxypeptidase Taq